uniref:EGF-like domain-containing protein n=1 Tax=Anopheles merus TaxID=30066 RepID=A0A182V139_ANOME
MKCPTLAACYGRRRTATTMMACYIGVLLCCCASLAAASNYYDVMGEHPVAYELVCPENEELRDTMPCCEPTCDHDCSNAKCSNAYVRQPTCVCKEGYVRHKGKCIRLRQCPAKPPVPPMCGDNEELLPSPPSCEPTCTDDCAGRPVHSRYLDQPTCVCKKGYRRHKGKCIRVDQCPSCGPYATLTESAPCCEPTCDNDCSNVLCISPVQTGEPKCVCQDGYVKHNSTCIKRELCPKTVYYVPKQFCRCGGKRKPKGRVPVKYVEATTPAPPCACQQQSEALSPDYYPAVTYSPASYPPMVYVSSPYVATTTPAPPCARPTNPPPRYAPPQPPQNYAPPKYAPYQPPATCAPPPVQYTAPPTTCAPPTAPPRPYYQPSPPPSYTPPKYLPAPPPPPYSYTAPPRVEASTCAPPKPSYLPTPCNGPPPPPPPPPPPCGSSVTMQPPSYQYQPTPPPAPKPYTYPATTPQPYAYQPTTPRPYYQQPPSSYQDQPYYAIPALKQCSCSINAATGGPPCGTGCARQPPISFNVATPSTTTAAPTTTVCPPACPCQFQYNQQHPVAYQDQPYVPQPPTTTARQPVDVPFIPLAGPSCYTPPPGCPAGVPVGVPGGAPGSGSYFSVGGYGGAPPLLSAGGYGGAPLVSAGGYGGAPPVASVGGYGGAPPVVSAGGYGGSAPPVVSAGGYDGSLAAATSPGGDSIATAGAPSGPFLSVLHYGV